MLFPSKHINFSKSLLGLGSNILQHLDTPKDVDWVWNLYQKDVKEGRYPAAHTFENFMLAIVFLYGIGSIEAEGPMLRRCA
jgi:hypothetical protein